VLFRTASGCRIGDYRTASGCRTFCRTEVDERKRRRRDQKKENKEAERR
jgi:hypothetical protein